VPPIYDLDGSDLVGVLWDALDDRYAAADPADVAEALDTALDAMSPAEAFSFTNALRQIERTAGQVVANPMVRQVAGAALPLAGTAVGGPIGGVLGSLVAQHLAGPTPPTGSVTPLPAGSSTPPAPAGTSTPPAPAGTSIPPALVGTSTPATPSGGSLAATQALIGAQQPEFLKALLAAAMGSHGQTAVNGLPVASLLAGFSKLLGEAAADADAVMYHAGETSEDVPFDDGPSLYTTLMDAADCEMWAS
jgi:hypothetical protein